MREQQLDITYTIAHRLQLARQWNKCVKHCIDSSIVRYHSLIFYLQATRQNVIQVNNKPSLPWLLFTGVAAVGLFSVTYNIPRWMENELVQEPIGNSTQLSIGLQRTELGDSFVYQLVYFDTFYYIFMFVLPLVLLTIFNSRLIVVYRRFRQKRVALHASSSGYSPQLDLTRPVS